MARVSQAGKICYLAIDRLLHAQLRISTAEDAEYRSWLIQLNEALENALRVAVERGELASDKKNLVAHYALSSLQVLAYNGHPRREESTRIKHQHFEEQEGPDFPLDAVAEHDDAFRLAWMVFHFDKLQERHKIDPAVTNRIVSELINTDSLRFSSINPALLVDLSLMCQLATMQSAPISLLCYAVERGWLLSSKIQPPAEATADVPELIQRLALQAELGEIAISLKVMIDSVSAVEDEVVQTPFTESEVKLKKISLFLDSLTNKAGRRLLETIIDGKKSIPTETAIAAGNSDTALLEYATRHWDMRLLVKETPTRVSRYNLGRIVSILGAQQILEKIAFGNEAGLPIFNGGDSTAPTLAGSVSTDLKSAFGISVTPNTLYKAYAASQRAEFLARRRSWFFYKHKNSHGLWPWNDLQWLDME